MTNTQECVTTAIRQSISELTPSQAGEVYILYASLKKQVDEAGVVGIFALALLGAEKSGQ